MTANAAGDPLGPLAAASCLTLPDGRSLGIAEWGDPRGPPLFVFHGHPGSRAQAALTAEPARGLGLRVIAFDRPGMGLSDFQPGRTLLDGPRDVVAVADHLGIDRFAVLGVSGGGPPACAAAFALPERVTTCGLAVALGPIDRFGARGMILPNRIGLWFAARSPRMASAAYRAVFGGSPAPPLSRCETSVARLARMLAKVDRQALADPAFARMLALDLSESLRQGVRGPAYEAWLYSRPWGFELEDIRCSRVVLWHGAEDRQVPVRMARGVAAAIPGCEAHIYPDHGHFSLIRDLVDEILSEFVG